MSAFVEYTVDGEVRTKEFPYGPGYLETAYLYASNLDSWDRIYEVIDGEQVVRTTPPVDNPVPERHPANLQ